MLGKNQIKLITGLRQKKFRDVERLFFAEGPKVVREFYQAGFELEKWFALKGCHIGGMPPAIEVSEGELGKISALTTPNQCLAIYRIPSGLNLPKSRITVVLDDIRDPGNLGTIIRLCDWFGVTNLVCSKESADIYNPKVVQATMGSLARVEVSYADLSAYISGFEGEIIGTFMDGENLYESTFTENIAIVLGNEANGISSQIEKRCTRRIAIPRFGPLQKAESLNVATAAAVMLGELRRRE